MDNFMFQKLMNAKKEEIEVLTEEKENDKKTSQEDNKEGYDFFTSDGPRIILNLWISISKEIIKEVFIKIVMATI